MAVNNAVHVSSTFFKADLMKPSQAPRKTVLSIPLARPLMTAAMLSAAWGAFLLGGCGRPEAFVEPELLRLEGNLGAHDPVIIREKDTYYVFATGGRAGRGFTPIKCSAELLTWNSCGSVFDKLPEWAPVEIPGTDGIWAPDISYFNGRYHLY